MIKLQCALLISLLIAYQCTLMCRLLKRQMSLFSNSLFCPPCRRAQEQGEYGEAILLCVQCFQGVEALKDLKVGHAARGSFAYIMALGMRLLLKVDRCCCPCAPTCMMRLHICHD